ncbi:MAG TPA: secondary thiamine-phosphate synthase, partial [Methylophaga sp.]|nr:secondary thiamine-phosphate synthase [Methylophaga sp.]
MILQQQLQFEMNGRSTLNISDDVTKIV